MWTERDKPRQRALPQTEALPAPHRRFDQVCAPGYQGRKRGEVVRTRTVILQAHTHQFLGTFGGPGNGDYRGELLRAIAVTTNYVTKLGLTPDFPRLFSLPLIFLIHLSLTPMTRYLAEVPRNG